jgi:hypothetical protein
MKRISAAICAASLGLTFAGASMFGAQAAPFPSLKGETFGVDIQQVQYRGRDDRPRVDHRAPDRRFEGRRGFERRGNLGYYNGHRGYSQYRRGYRQHNGFWFPSSAFVAGMIGGAIAAQPPVVVARPVPMRLSAAHVRWCQDRWRSYSVSDNSFQPLNGPRQACVSPY